MNFIDTHIHLQDFKMSFALDVLNNDNVKKMFVVASKSLDFEKIAKLVDDFPYKVVGGFGVHPWYVKDDADLGLVEEYLKKYENAMVGEIGVDGIKGEVTDIQHYMFDEQIKLAKKFKRNVIIHGAKAFEPLKMHENSLKEVRFVYHGFSKNEELIKFINKCGGWFGLGSMFVKQKKAKDLFLMMPRDKILFETDAPYQLNEKNYCEEVITNINMLANALHLDIDELKALLIDNAERFLDGK